MNCSNKDNATKVNDVEESQMNGEPPTSTIPSMSEREQGQVEISSLQSVAPESPAQLEFKNNPHKSPVFLIKNASGKAVPLVFKKSILLKNSEIVEQKVFANNNRTLITVPNQLIANGNTLQSPNAKKPEISTPILIIPPNSKTGEKTTQNPKEKLEISTGISTKNSTKISTGKSTPKLENEAATTKPTKLVINRKLVPVSTTPPISTSSVSTASATTSNSDFVSTFQEFIIKTSSGKQIIIPNKIKPVPKVEISEKTVEQAPKIAPENVNRLKYPITHNLLNTKNIIINNQVVPVSLNTKFTVETGSNTEKSEVDNSDTVLNIITKKTVETLDPKAVETKGRRQRGKPKKIDKLKTLQEEGKREKKEKEKEKQPKDIVKIPGKKLYQIQVEKGPKLVKQCANDVDDVDLLNGCVQLPMYVENWTQTDVKRQDAACQTDVYVSPSPILEPIDECPNIPELIEFLLFNPKYSTGMDEETKTDIINNSLKFKPAEMAPITPAPKPALSLKERLFYDLRDCIGTDFLGNMPIHNAVLDNNVNDLKRQVYALRLRRFNVDVENNFDQSALQLAVINNKNQDIISTLLVNGANVTVKDNLGNTLLHLAVLNTSHTILEMILGYFQKGATCINAKNDEGLTPLMIASIECKPESVGVLLKFGAKPNLRDDKSGRTALFHAVELNNIPVINLLLQNKADPKIRNFFGLTAIDAVKDMNTPVANLIEKQATRANTLEEPTAATSRKRRTDKRGTDAPVKRNKMAVVSKKQKVDLDSLEKQQQQQSVVPSHEMINNSAEKNKLEEK